MPKCADRTALCPMVGAGAPGCRLQHVGRGDAEQRVAEVSAVLWLSVGPTGPALTLGCGPMRLAGWSTPESRKV